MSATDIVLPLLAGLLLGAPDAPGPETADDENVLRAAGVPVDGPGLVTFFTRQTPTEDSRRKIQELVGRLGHEAFPVREQASTDLVTFGPSAVPALQAALKSDDAEVRRRAAECLRLLEQANLRPVLTAAARLLAQRRPDGATAAILGYLPVAQDPEVAGELDTTLAALATRNGRADPVLVRALADGSAPRRAAAAVALARAALPDQRPALLRLLADADAQVRLRVALALARAKEKAAVPVLIDLVTGLPAEETAAAQELLYLLAENDAPPPPVKPDEAARRQWREAWLAWWKKAAPAADLGKAGDTARFLGYTLVVLLDGKKVVELDPRGGQRWEIGGLESPLDAHVLPGDRVLITEHQSKRVTERNFKGDVLWEKQLEWSPTRAQRLPNGNTFIVTREKLLEVDRAGKVVFSHDFGGTSITTAVRLPDGRIRCVVGSGGGTDLVELTSAGKEVGRYRVNGGVQTTSSLTALPGGRSLVAEYGGGRVVEYSAAGKELWEAKVQSPISVVRLPGGNTLVSSQQNLLIELDRQGQVVQQTPIQGHPTQVRRR